MLYAEIRPVHMSQLAFLLLSLVLLLSLSLLRGGVVARAEVRV